MKIKYDAEADALYIALVEADSADSEEVQPGVVLDYDKEGHLIGVEVLSVKKRVPAIDPTRVEVDVA